MTELYRRFSDEVEFFVVYVQEAHPTDGWQTDSNIEEGVLFRQHRSYTERESEEGVLFRQHRSYTERESAAQSCSVDLHVGLPVIVEEMDNAIDEAYGAAPERLYLVDFDGRVAYHGGAGPHFFDLDEWEQAIEATVGVSANR